MVGGGGSLSFLNWVNLVSGPLGGRKPNGLIREEGLMIWTSSSGRGVQAGTSMAWCLMLQPPTAPRTCTSPRRALEHIFGSLGRSLSLTMNREEFTEEIHKKMKCVDLQGVLPYVLLLNRQFPHVFSPSSSSRLCWRLNNMRALKRSPPAGLLQDRIINLTHSSYQMGRTERFLVDMMWYSWKQTFFKSERLFLLLISCCDAVVTFSCLIRAVFGSGLPPMNN